MTYFTRKFVILDDKITTIPTDEFHNSVKGAIGGGYITLEGDKLYFYGKSHHFGEPDLRKLLKLLMEEVGEPFYLRSILRGVKNIYLSRMESLEELKSQIESGNMESVYSYCNL